MILSTKKISFFTVGAVLRVQVKFASFCIILLYMQLRSYRATNHRGIKFYIFIFYLGF